VVNDHDIYECKEKEPVIINCSEKVYKIIAVNGFHSSRKLVINNKPGIRIYEIGSYIDNVQLATGLVMTLLFFLIYIFSGILFFLFFANVPLLVMLYIFYVKRGEFIRVNLLKQGRDY
jgi:hypothetical protein